MSSGNHFKKIKISVFAKEDRLLHPSFFVSPQWEFEPSVVRVENCSMDTNKEDVRQLFASYQFIDERHKWDRRRAVELLISGDESNHKDCLSKVQTTSNRTTTNNNTTETKNGKFSQNKKTPLTTNTFLVRFQGPQDARAAIREKQMTFFHNKQLSLTAYPDQLIITTEK